MADLGVYTIAGEEIIFESFDGDAVVLDIGTGKYFGFSDLGSCAWEALASQVSASAILGLGAGTNKISAADLEAFVDRLLEFGLLVPAPGRAGEALSEDLAARFAGAKEPLSVEKHDELADLLQADPIHDVDEAMGWPVVRQDLQA
jgi:hypothetical protein